MRGPPFILGSVLLFHFLAEGFQLAFEVLHLVQSLLGGAPRVLQLTLQVGDGGLQLGDLVLQTTS